MTETDMLLRLRLFLLESIVQCSNEIEEIDRQLAVPRSQELEADLNQATEKAKP